jgi:hypothetical protein
MRGPKITVGAVPVGRQEIEHMKDLELSSAFYHGAVQPILKARFPTLVHSAGRLGAGSEMLGFDNETSQDHDRGSRLTVFLDSSSLGHEQARIPTAFAEDLPEPSVGRTGDVGDEIGSRIIATRQITKLMRLCFLAER